jgi:hypothetical protein
MSSAIAAGGVLLLAILAPFETTRPLVRLPAQSLSNLEAALLAAIAMWTMTLLLSAPRPAALLRRNLPLAAAWCAWIGAMAIASAFASTQAMNAWHMTGRMAAAFAVYALTVAGTTTSARLHAAVRLSVAAGVAVAILALLEYFRVGVVLQLLRAFRPSSTAVGALVRPGGPLQYPTIASMYLEVVFALGLGLLLAAIDRVRYLQAIGLFVALIAMVEAIALTLTRAGLVTVALSLLLVGLDRWRRFGWDRGARSIAAVAAVSALLFATSRPSQSLWLRMTSEGQDRWYRADIDAPAALAFDADASQYVTVALTNTGRLIWDSDADPPILFSYHWFDEEGARVVAYEGGRTRFEAPVAPGERVTIHALVRAPRYPGRYRLEWDLVQEGRLWFSTEQDAPDPVGTAATVSGISAGGPPPTSPRPRRSVRPGRLLLWKTAAGMIGARPWIGVGPDNFRLLYGSAAGLPGADPRTHTNNMYLEVLVGGGILTLIPFAWLLVGAGRLFAAAGGALAAAGAAIAVHGLVDSFLGFAPTYILFSLTLGFAAAAAGGAEPADAHRA